MPSISIKPKRPCLRSDEPTAFHISQTTHTIDRAIDSQNNRSSKSSLRRRRDADISSTSCEHSPKHQQQTLSRQNSMRSRPMTPTQRSPFQNAPNFSRTINSIRKSARNSVDAADNRPSFYKDASDREIQLSAEKFLQSVEKQNAFAKHVPRICVNSRSRRSSNSDNECIEFEKCRIVGDEIIQSNYTNALADDMTTTSCSQSCADIALGALDSRDGKCLTRKMEIDDRNDLLDRLSDSSDLEYSMSSIEYQISRLKLLGIPSSQTSLSQGPTHRMPYGPLDLSDGEILSEGEIRTGSSERF